MKSDLWFYEKYEETAVGFHIKNILFNNKSKFQEVMVLETINNGKLLLLDGVIMLTERNEFVYHDMIAHVPLFVHPSPENVLIIGGGDGGTAREVLRHNDVKKVDMVEIDGMVVEACKKTGFCTATAFENPKLNLHITDGIEFVKNAKNKYDVILIDSSDPVGPAEGLFGKEFYQNAFEALKDDGILVAQSESPFYMDNIFADYYHIVGSIFPILKPYLAFIPDYPSGMWSFSFASKKYHPIKDFNPQRVENMNLKTKYYNKDIHIASFSLPQFVKDKLK